MYQPLQAEDKAQTILKQIWLRAWKEGKAELNLKDKSSRTAMRFALYNLAKRVKNAPEEYEPDLVEAVNGCQISITGDTQLTMTHRKLTAIVMDLAEQLGIDVKALEEEARDREAQIMGESVRRVMDAVAEAPKAGADKLKVYK